MRYSLWLHLHLDLRLRLQLWARLEKRRQQLRQQLRLSQVVWGQLSRQWERQRRRRWRWRWGRWRKRWPGTRGTVRGSGHCEKPPAETEPQHKHTHTHQSNRCNDCMRARTAQAMQRQLNGPLETCLRSSYQWASLCAYQASAQPNTGSHTRSMYPIRQQVHNKLVRPRSLLVFFFVSPPCLTTHTLKHTNTQTPAGQHTLIVHVLLDTEAAGTTSVTTNGSSFMHFMRNPSTLWLQPTCACHNEASSISDCLAKSHGTKTQCEVSHPKAAVLSSHSHPSQQNAARRTPYKVVWSGNMAPSERRYLSRANTTLAMRDGANKPGRSQLETITST